MKNGDKLLVDIIDLGMNGEGVAKVDGVPLFVPHAVTGDLCKVKVVTAKKDYAFGELVKVVRPSAIRVTPPCPYFTDCGGCDLQHVNATEQASFKRAQVQNCLRKAGLSVEVEETVCGKQYGYRNKLQLPFGLRDGKVVLGFFKKATHEVVPMTNCILHGDWAEKLIKSVSYWANLHSVSVYDEGSGKGILRHLAARYVDGFLSVTLVICGDTVPHVSDLVSALKKDFDFNLYLNKNVKNTNVILGATTARIYGADKLLNICGIKQTLSPLSFLQVNDEIRDKIYSRVVDSLENSNIVFDVFSGAGALSAMLAKRLKSTYLPCVYGIEIVPEAVADANELMRLNGLSDKVKNLCGDATVVLPKLAEDILNQYISYDKSRDNAVIANEHNGTINAKSSTKPRTAVLLDPPRKGCEKEVLNAIITSSAETVIYVSCNPATLSRDLKLLSPYYTITSITPYDMFPQTRHVETLVSLVKKS